MKRLNKRTLRPKQGLEACQNYIKLKANDKATFFSLADKWFLPSVSAKEPEEKEFVFDSGASMHKVSEKDLNFVELETMRTSRSPTTVMTANDEVQTREEATVYVEELDLFVTVLLLSRNSRSAFIGETLRRTWVHVLLDQRSKTSSNQKRQEN